MKFKPLPSEVLETIISGIRIFLRDQKDISPQYRAESLRLALARPSFYPEDLLEQINERRGNRSIPSYLRSHDPFKQAFGKYLGR